MKQIQITKRIRKQDDRRDLDLRSPSGRQLPY